MRTRHHLHARTKLGLALRGVLGISLAAFLLASNGKAQGIAFVQLNSATPQTAQSSVAASFTSPQISGDLNVILVAWNNSTVTIQSVTDVSRNAYLLAAGPTILSGHATQAIYYANNIAGASANANTVTVKFSAAAPFVDLRILEYSGVDPVSPLDSAVGTSGTSAMSNSGATTTTNANDLLVGANYVQTFTTGAGAGYTSRVITSLDGDIAEDRTVAQVGSYNATAPLNPSGWWVMQMAAFRAAGSGPPPVTITVAPSTANVGTGLPQQFTATVQNTTNTGVNWSLSGAGCTGTACGTLNSTTANPVTYTAPATIPNPATVTLTATAAADNTKSASATITVTPVAAAIKFIQVGSATPATAQISVGASYTSAQIAGDLNVVVVGWNDSTATIQSVMDLSGNIYAPAVGPTILSGFATQSIYYAKNIAGAAANANTVTVNFNVAAQAVDLRILEYGGVNQVSPLDVAVGGSGTGATSSSGTVTTTNANDLLIGANYVQTHTTNAGAGYTSRVITSPDGDIAEDRVVAATGSYSATATVFGSGWWVMQMAAFRAAGSGPPPVTITVAPSTANVGTGLPQQFTATVQNTTNTGVNWSLSGAGCTGTACGTLNSTTANPVTYTAPATIPNPATVTLTATAAADNTKSAAARITVVVPIVSVTLTPRGTGLTYSQTQQFAAAVSGTGNTAVTWTVDEIPSGNSTVGTLAVNGLTAIYTPPSSPGTHVIKATSVADSTKSASSTVAVTDFAGIFTNHNDVARTGQNIHELGLTPSTVNVSQFGKLFSCPIDGFAYAQPLYIPNLAIPNQGVHNVVFVATENDSVYAFDADDPSCVQLWFTSFLGPNIAPVPAVDTGDIDPDDLQPQIGITGTPVIDPSTHTLYVVANTKEPGPAYFYRLHALDITTGAEKFGGPVAIQGSVPGTGDASSGGQVPFTPLYHLQRPGLLLLNGEIYIVFGSHGDVGLYHGWVFAYDARTLNRLGIFNTAPNGTKGGIWQTGGGPSGDSGGGVYVTTSNGAFDASVGGIDYGDTFLRLSLSGSLSVADYFTPSDQNYLDVHDYDVGTTSALVLPDSVGSVAHPHLLVGGAKDGHLYLLDRDNLSHFHPTDQSVQKVVATTLVGRVTQGVFGSLAYWSNNLYVCPVGDALKVFSLANGLISTVAASQSSRTFGLRGAVPSVSANGSANGIVWVVDVSANQTAGPAILFAYDATNLANKLYDSTQAAGARDQAAAPVKYATPTVANAKVYLATRSKLEVYGLLP